jgi:ABC-type multidrug transport system fused ATPase/permease subunit
MVLIIIIIIIIIITENTMKHKYHSINKKIQNLTKEQRKDTQPINNTFYKRVENLTNITFTNDETQLLSKELKYNLHHKHINWIKTLAIEADTAISQLNTT